MHRLPTRFAVAFVAGLLIFTPARAQDNTTDTAKLIEVLQLKPGSVVAEIGAGNGALTIAIAKHVGPTGRLYTSELGEERLRALRQAIEKSRLQNVRVVEGQPTAANLPDGCCDAIFMRNVYHHFGDPMPMLSTIRRALKPGGRIAVIDFPPRNNAATAAAGKRGEDAHHGVSADTTSRELAAGGFDIISSEERPNRWFIVVGAARP
jgi:precorrin-6B methylase 2